MAELIQFRTEETELLPYGAVFDAEAVGSCLPLFRPKLFFQKAAVAITVQQFIDVLDQVHFIQQRSLQFADSHIVPASRFLFKRAGRTAEIEEVIGCSKSI